MDTILPPNELFDKAIFIFMEVDGMFKTKKLLEGDVVLVGRCPTTGPDNQVPMTARRVKSNEKSCRALIDLSKLNNLDFDGDEVQEHKGEY